jgi:hypothetical protein
VDPELGAAGPPLGGGCSPPAAPPGAYQAPPPPYPYPGPPAYPGGAARRRDRRRRGLMLAVTAAVAVVVGAAAAVTLLGKTESPATMARQAGQALASAPALSLTGTIAGQDAILTVTRAGTVEGHYTQNGNPVTRVTINGVTYLKAPTAFWRSVVLDPVSAQQAGGNWAKALGNAVNMTFDSLTPGQIGRALEHAGNNPRATAVTLGGTKVIRLTEHSAGYYISAAAPNRLLRVSGVSGAMPYSFDVTPLTPATVGPVFTALHADVRALRGAVDPGAIVTQVQQLRFHSDCNAVVSCTVSGTVSVNDPTTPTVLLKMTVDFSGTEHGAAFASCSDTVPVAQGATATPACGLSGPVWSGWFTSHTRNFFTWADAHFEATMNSARDITRLQRELDQQQSA